MNFEHMVGRIVAESKISHDELMSRIHGKQRELGGFVTMEGAANIVAREMGIIFEHKEPEVRPMRIEDLIPGMSKVDIVGRVVRVREPREFHRSNGTSGFVGSLSLQDRTGWIRLALWDDKTSLIKEGKVQKGDIVRVRNAYVREGLDKQPELSLGSRGTVDVNPEDPRSGELLPLSDACTKIGDLKLEMGEVDVLGTVVAVSECRTFERPDKTTGKVSTLIISDSTGQVRVSLWSEWAEQAGELRRGDAVKLENALIRLGLGNRVELSLDSRGRLVKCPQETVELPKLPERPLKIGEIEADMPYLDIAARVVRKLPPHEFKRGDGSTGKVASAVLADETGTVRASFWGAAAETVQKLQPDDVVSLKNAYSRVGLGGRVEIHVGGSTRIEVNPAGVNVDGPKSGPVKTREIEPNMDAIDIVGRAMEVAKPRDFTRPDGRKGKVASVTIGDETGTIRVSLWHEQADNADRIKAGDVLKFTNCYSTLGLFGQPELHLGIHGRIDVSEADEGLPPTEALETAGPDMEPVKIAEIDKEGMRVQVRGTVVQVFHRRPIFDTCPNCGRSLGSVDTSMFCEECGKVVTPEHRVILSFLLDDGTDNIRVVLFGKVAERLLGMDAGQVLEMFKGTPDLAELYDKLELVGKELLVTGTSQQDKYLNQIEIRGSDAQFPDPKQEARFILEKLKDEAGRP